MDKIKFTDTAERRTGFPGTWRSGKIIVPSKTNGETVFRYELKYYDTGSKYGINGGRISKLWITDLPDRREEIVYDRGWEEQPDENNAALMAAYCILLNNFN